MSFGKILTLLIIIIGIGIAITSNTAILSNAQNQTMTPNSAESNSTTMIMKSTTKLTELSNNKAIAMGVYALILISLFMLVMKVL